MVDEASIPPAIPTGKAMSRVRSRREGILYYLRLILIWNLVSGALLGGYFLANRGMHWDNHRLYSIFRDNNYSLNYFGEVMWWNPSDNMGFPTFYFSHLGTNTFTPLGAVVLTSSWLLGRVGIIIQDYTIPYIVYFTFLVPLLFSTSLFLLASQIFRHHYVRVFIIILAAFSPGVVFNYSDNGLEEIGYALLFAAALLKYYRQPQKRNFFWLIAAGAMLAISFNHLAIYCNVAFLCSFVAVLFLVQRDGQRMADRLRSFVAGVSWPLWLAGIAIVVGCLQPTLISFRQGRDILRTRNAERWYPFEYLRAGNPVEFLTVSSPGIAFDWMPAAGPEAQWTILGYRDCRFPAYTYMGIMALPLSFVGWCFGRRPWRWRLFLMTAIMGLIVALQGWSSVFAAVLVWPTPFRACNHFNDTIFRTTISFLMILNAALGLESVLVNKRLQRVVLPIAMGVSILLSALLLGVVHGRALLGDPLFGFFAAASAVFVVLAINWASSKTEKQYQFAVTMILLLTALDVSTASFWHVRRFMWKAPTGLRDPQPGDVGLPASDERAGYARLVLGLRSRHNLLSSGVKPEQLSAILPLALFDRATVIAFEQAPTLDYSHLSSVAIAPGDPLSHEFAEFLGNSSPGRMVAPVLKASAQTYNRLELEMEIDKPQILLWRDSYFPGWKATVNDEPAPIVQAFWCFKAIKVPAGNVKVSFQFSQHRLLRALVLGYLAIIGCFVAGCFGRRSDTSPARPNPRDRAASESVAAPLETPDSSDPLRSNPPEAVPVNKTAPPPSTTGTETLLPRLSVVFSFRNEEDVLVEAIERVRAVLGEERVRGRISGHELVFVNDASCDRSLAILKEAACGHDDIRVVNMARNFGVSPCVLAGMEHSSGDLVVYMDVDLQDPPEVIHDMLQAWQETGADVVHTVRRSRAGEGRVKLAVTWLGYRILHLVSSVQIRIEAGDFKLLTRRAVSELVRLREKRPFLRGLVAWVGFPQTEVYYDRLARHGGTTKFPVLGLKVIRNFLDSALISFSDIPLQAATVLGALTSLAAFLFLLYIVVEKMLGHNLPGWSAIMATMLFLGGAQLLFLGIMGLYINSIYLETKGRPNYVVESTFGFPEPPQNGPGRGNETPPPPVKNGVNPPAS